MASLATLTTAATIVAATATVAGTAISAYGSMEAGRRAQESAEIIARQEEMQGKDEFAASQREARERALEGALVRSRQQAVAAASGGGAGADAPSIVTLMQKTAERTRYGMDSVIYLGAQRRDRLNASAAARRRTGANEFAGSLYTAAGTLAGGIGRTAEIFT